MHSEKPSLFITSFGNFSIDVRDTARVGQGRPLITDSHGHSKKMWTLLEYLLFSGKEKIPTDELIELLWPEDDFSADPLNSLRLLVHRSRAELNRLGCYRGSELVLSGNGTYGWNHEIPLVMDTEHFETLYQNSFKGNPSKRLNDMLSAIAIYRGHFLPRTSYQQWAMTLNTYYHSKYTALCLQTIDLLQRMGQHRQILDVCTKALSLDPYNEQFHIALIRSLAAGGHRSEAMAHYRRVTELFLKELGTRPSEKMAEVYKGISRNIQAEELGIGTIRDSLSENDAHGAFYCEYEMFRQIYMLKQRECQRSGQMVQLALITALPCKGRSPGERARRTMMDRLSTVIRDSLRQGDTYTQYSPTQYLLLLQSASFENGKTVLARIQRNYRQSFYWSDFLLQYSLLPMLPKASPADVIPT